MSINEEANDSTEGGVAAGRRGASDAFSLFSGELEVQSDERGRCGIGWGHGSNAITAVAVDGIHSYRGSG